MIAGKIENGQATGSDWHPRGGGFAGAQPVDSRVRANRDVTLWPRVDRQKCSENHSGVLPPLQVRVSRWNDEM